MSGLAKAVEMIQSLPPEQRNVLVTMAMPSKPSRRDDPDTSGLTELELQTLATQYACDEVERLLKERELLLRAARILLMCSLPSDISGRNMVEQARAMIEKAESGIQSGSGDE